MPPPDTSPADAVLALGDARSPRQEAAFDRLSALGAAAVPALLQGLRDDRVGGVGAARMLQLLGESPVADALPAVIAALTDPRDIVRAAAITAVAGFADPRATAALVALLDDPDPNVVQQASIRLGERRDEGAVLPLTRLLARDDQGVRFGAAKALLAIDNPAARDAVRTNLATERDAEIRALIEQHTSARHGDTGPRADQ